MSKIKLLKTFLISCLFAIAETSLHAQGLVNVSGDSNPTGMGTAGLGTGNGDLRYVLNYINQNPGTYNVTFNSITPTINLGGMLPIINLTAANTITIDGTNGGSPITIDGSNTFPGFIIYEGNVSISNMSINNTLSQGGNGGAGGLGAGGGLCIFGNGTSGATPITLSNVTFNHNTATGGIGTAKTGFVQPLSYGGGGMFGGNAQSMADGGGGMGGLGGSSATGSGGGGIGGGPGGTGGAQGSAGTNGGAFGAGSGGSGGGGAGGIDGGGGGGANGGFTIGAGAGGVNGGSATTAAGGSGVFGGGGGRGTPAGNGGFGGGGAGSSTSANTPLGSGGFGGGGGSGGALATNTPGSGGFGAGGGTSATAVGASGIGGGVGVAAGNGNGGAGFGGAIFVNTGTNHGQGGASLIINGPIPNNFITGGSVFGGGQVLGAAVGTDIFATNGLNAVVFNISSGSTTFANSIFDDSSNSIGSGTWQPGSGTGAQVVKQGTGTLILNAPSNSKYSGGTSLTGGTLQVVTPGSLGNTASAVTFAGSGIITLQAGASITIQNPIVTNNSNNTFDSNGFSFQLSGAITGSGTLNKIGTGTLTLTNSGNSYAATIINAGTLALSGSGTLPTTAPLTIDSGTLFDISAITSTTTIGDLLGSGNINLGAKNLTLGTSDSTTFSGTISGTGGSLTKQGSGTLTLIGTETYTGATNITGGIIQLTTSTLDPTGGIVLTSPGAVDFIQNFTGSYAGDISGSGSLVAGGGGTINLTGTNSYNNGTTIQANTTLYGTPTSIQGNISNSGTLDFQGPGTYSGVISGSGPTEINFFTGGSGTVSFSAAQTYTGNTTIFAGTLALINTGSISTSPLLTINSGTTFDISGITNSPTTVGQLAGSGTINVGTNTLITSTTTSPVTFAGTIEGTGGFTQGGTGTLILTATNPLFSGTVTVASGLLQITPATFISTTNIVDNSILDFEQVSGTGIYGGPISGTGAVTINNAGLGNAGTVEFTALNSYTGLTTITAGNLIISQSAANTFTGPFSIAGGTNLDFEQGPLATTIGTFSGDISGAGTITVNQQGGPGIVVLSGTKSYTGTTTVYNGTLELLNTSNSTSTSPIVVKTGALLDIDQAATKIGTYSGGISGGGNVSINKFSNSGTVILSGINNYTGTTTVFAGLLEIQNTATNTFASTITINSGATLDLEQAVNTVGTYSGGISGAGNLDINQSGSTGTIYFPSPDTATGTTTVFAGTLAGTTATLPTAQPIKVNTGGTVDVEQPSGSGTFLGSIQDNGITQHGAVAINKLGGTGTVILGGSNSYTGGTKVYNGTLQGTPATLSGIIAVNSGASVDIEQASGSGTFSGSIINNGVGQNGAVTINKQGGTGTVVFSGVNTYTGGTTVYKGALQIQPAFLTGNVSLASGASLNIEQPSSTGTFTGNISGGGSVNINNVAGNTGTILLSGSNSYTGGTFVQAGTLQGDTNSLFGTITDNANVNFVQNFNGTFNGTFLGNGNIGISGTGIVTFDTNSSPFTGTTNISGSLNLNAILGGNVVVDAFGLLTGAGTVLGNVTLEDMGVIRPGSANSTGTININGNFTQFTGSIYQVQLKSNDQSSLLNIGGQATLEQGSELTIISLDGIPAIDTIYTIVSAAGGVNGTYSVVNFPMSIITPTVSYDPTHVYVTFQANFTPIAITNNQKQVANQLATINVNSPEALKELLRELALIPPFEGSIALSQMSAEQYTNVLFTAELANRQFIKRLFDPLRTIITTNPCKTDVCCSYILNYDTWLSVSGGRTFIHGNSNARGFRIADFEITAGAQTTLAKRWTVGTAVSYEKDSIGYKVGGSGKCNTVLGGLYGLYRGKRYYALADATLGYSLNKVRRTINVGTLHYFPRGKPKIYQFSAYAEIGTDFSLDNTLIQPFIGLECGHFRFNSFSECGGFPIAVNVSGRCKTNSYTWLGVHLTSPPMRCGFSMNLDLAWQYRLTSLSNNIGVQFQDFGSPFPVQGLPLNRNSYEAIVRFNQIITRKWDAFFEGSCHGWDNSTSFSFVAGVQATW